MCLNFLAFQSEVFVWFKLALKSKKIMHDILVNLLYAGSFLSELLDFTTYLLWFIRMLTLTYSPPFIIKRLESIKKSRTSNSVVVSFFD